jgi:hypothetical protein
MTTDAAQASKSCLTEAVEQTEASQKGFKGGL